MSCVRNNNNTNNVNNLKKVYYCCVPTTVPTFNSYLMATNTVADSVLVGGVVPFDTTVESSSVTMSPSGTFTIGAAGIYLVNWWVSATNNGAEAAVLSTSLSEVTPTAEVLSSATSGFEVGAGDSAVIQGVALINAPANSTYNITNSGTTDFTTLIQNDLGATITVNRIN